MRVLPFICLLIGCCLAAPSDSNEHKAPETFVFNNFIKEENVIYTAKHDIVRIFAPINQFPKHDFWSDFVDVKDSSEEEPEKPRQLFIVEADIDNGKVTEQGLYFYNNGTVTKLLDNGRDAIANNDNEIYFGASDGIYKYNQAANKAEKHGSVTDNIIQLAFFNFTNTIYYVTANHEVFKLNTEATASEKVATLKDVQSLVFGYDRKAYFYDSKKDVYVYDEENNVAPKKIEGLPENIDKISLSSPLLGMEEGANLLVDGVLYLIKPDGSSSITKTRVTGKPTAYEPKPTCHQFYAENKKLYEIDTMAMLMQLGAAAEGHHHHS
ncbi:uncharacterized protein LOC125236985 [Leguminivora glycinivorella]|uniref:uncharacterized protein LOC125236985 n=1 Tax=Leguminivora glycinivorella TaxID=1035111 RepID=UPI00200D54AF|nr:uncharacterized protein LOC125236985 [Leguminivora glycinivorella]